MRGIQSLSRKSLFLYFAQPTRLPQSLHRIRFSRKMQQDEQVQKLYEEMESQLKQEKERALNEVSHLDSASMPG